MLRICACRIVTDSTVENCHGKLLNGNCSRELLRQKYCRKLLNTELLGKSSVKSTVTERKSSVKSTITVRKSSVGERNRRDTGNAEMDGGRDGEPDNVIPHGSRRDCFEI